MDRLQSFFVVRPTIAFYSAAPRLARALSLLLFHLQGDIFTDAPEMRPAIDRLARDKAEAARILEGLQGLS